MTVSKFLKKIEAKLRFFAHWRCRENLILFESDDWGLQRMDASENLQAYGEPKIWAREQIESVEDLRELNKLLLSFQDKNNRPCCFTAYFIVANPDFSKISDSGFKNYADNSIETFVELKNSWNTCYNNKTFLPQYHGRFHQNPVTWLKDLQNNKNQAREFFKLNHAPGISLNKGKGQLYQSEYYNYHKEPHTVIPDIESWVKTGLQYFKNTFGYSPAISVAPHYMYNSTVSATWKNQGIKYIQGNNYHLIVKNNKEISISHCLGEKNSHGTTLLCRNINFEPSSQISARNSDQCITQVKKLFEQNIPAIIDTHRINYTGRFKNEGIKQLKKLISSTRDKETLFLTSLELGQAIENNGHYTDPWTGQENKLTPLDNFLRKTVRYFLAGLNNSRMAKNNDYFSS